jgi:hypothetical protein
MVVYGDMRFTDPSNVSDTWPRVRKYLAEKVGEEKPDVLLLTGDMPFRGSNPADWQIYESETASWKQEGLRVFPTIGNHELIPDIPSGLANYFKAFPQISRHRWYSALIGNVLLITLDSTIPYSEGTPQRGWLEAQMNHLPPQVDFVFFLFHIPLVADLQSSFILGIPSPPTLEFRQYLEAQAAKSHAAFAIFNGHLHNYERFDIQGIMHVITGGGGARPYPVFLRGDQDLFPTVPDPTFNYVVLTIDGKHADAKMYGVVDPKAAAFSMKQEDSFSLGVPAAKPSSTDGAAK